MKPVDEFMHILLCIVICYGSQAASIGSMLAQWYELGIGYPICQFVALYIFYSLAFRIDSNLIFVVYRT